MNTDRMNKTEYQKRSHKLRLPQRCPLVGYCQRWAWTIYFYNYWGLPKTSNNMGYVLRDAGDLPDDYEEKKIKLSVESPEIGRGDDFYFGYNLCPDVPLFDRQHTPGVIPAEAVSSFSWLKHSGMQHIEYKHFSECLEFIQNTNIKPKPQRKPIPTKLRFQILERDNFTCVYCGKSAKDGAELHVDHKTSVKDGGKNKPNNLVTACAECNFGKGGKSLS